MQTLILFWTALFLVAASAHEANKPAPFKPPVHYARACLTEICGPPARVENHIHKYLDRIKQYYLYYVTDKNQINFPPDTAKLIEQIEKIMKEKDELLLEKLKNSLPMPGKKTEGLSKALDNLQRVAPLIDKVKYQEIMVNGRVEETVDVEASKKAMKGAPVGDQEMAIQLMKSLKSVTDVMSEPAIQSNPPDIVLKALHPKLSTREAMLKEIGRAKTQMESLKDATPMEKAFYMSGLTPEQLALIEEQSTNGSVDENGARAVLSWNSSFRRNKLLMNDNKSPLLAGDSRDVEELVQKAGSVAGIEKNLRDKWNTKAKNRIRKIEECKRQYFLNKGLLPSKAESDRLKVDIERAKKRVAELVKQKFPPSTQAKALKAVEKAEFVLPPTADDFEKSFARKLTQSMDAERADLASLQKLEPSDLRPIMAAMGQPKADKTQDDSEEDSPCDSYKYEPVSDANYTLYGSIVLRYSTATGPESARLKTIMHELGHSISKAISEDAEESRKFAGVRRCLEQVHTEEPPPTTKETAELMKDRNPSSKGYYVEEDFADSIAFEAGKDVRGANPWCALVSTTIDRQDYDEDSMQAYDKDVHSAAIFRLLNFEMTQKGSLPETCRNFFRSVGYVEGFKSCLDLAKAQYPTSTSPTTR